MMWLALLLYLLFLIGAGYALPSMPSAKIARAVAWSIALFTVIFTTLITGNETPLFRMIVIGYLQLLSMKVIVAVECYRGAIKLQPFQWIAFALGWFGMRPQPFENLPSSPLPGLEMIIKGASRIIIGFILLYFSTLTERYRFANVFYVTQLFLLAGFSFILHFGLFNLLAALWRWMGVETYELFRSPLKSNSLKEFWGKRWNLAFSEMSTIISFRPLRGIIGVEKAIIVSFLLSGLLHEIVISFPVNSGYGLPMLYFIIQAAAMQLESTSGLAKEMIRHPILSHLWVLGFLLLPLPLLFHPDFIRYVLIPLRNILLNI